MTKSFVCVRLQKIMTKEKPVGDVAEESVPMTFIRVLGNPYLRATALRCVASIVRHFFLRQFRSAFLPGLIPVSRADHPLDSKIPFLPAKVKIYIDFVAFWIRALSFLLRTCGRRALEPARNFMETMGGLYAFAAEVYAKNLSTTHRPFYIANPRFFTIHALDPHLMCVPSLHVMVVIRGYTFFADIFKSFGKETQFASQAEELRRGALAITEAVLYVKQHSVNCIPAALYAMTRFEPRLFPPGEAERFVSELYRKEKVPGKDDAEEIRQHILSLYRRFISQGESGGDWKEPLLTFLGEMPRA
jgi:hypothetical protein